MSFCSSQPTLSFEIMAHPAEPHHENLLQISNSTGSFGRGRDVEFL